MGGQNAAHILVQAFGPQVVAGSSRDRRRGRPIGIDAVFEQAEDSTNVEACAGSGRHVERRRETKLSSHIDRGAHVYGRGKRCQPREKLDPDVLNVRVIRREETFRRVRDDRRLRMKRKTLSRQKPV